MERSIPYIDAASTADLLRGVDQDNTIIVDVRGQDFLGGNIKDCVNISSERFQDDDDVDAIIKEHLGGKDNVIVHCALSQVRGPFCADRLASRLAAAAEDGQPQPKVQILAQGFNGFVKLYGKDADLCTDVDPSIRRD